MQLNYAPMLSNFHVMLSVWLPDRLTRAFGARVKTMFAVLHADTSAAQFATATGVRARVPLAPAPPLENVAAAQETSTAAQVAALATDGVNAAALA